MHPTRRLQALVRHELHAAARHEARGEFTTAFTHLERAHVLGQQNTLLHVRTHAAMLGWAWRQQVAGEALGQAWRVLGALLKTWLWVPAGNTGGAGVSGFRPMPIPPDLQRLMDRAAR